MTSSPNFPRKTKRPPQGAAHVAVSDEVPLDADQPPLCRCCEPRNLLVMRPDFGVLADGSAEFALCVLHEPEPRVYQNRGDGVYAPAPHLVLSPAGELVDQLGAVVARVPGMDFQRLSTVDDEDDAQDSPLDHGSDEPRRSASPQTVHVDLGQDDFYRQSHG